MKHARFIFACVNIGWWRIEIDAWRTDETTVELVSIASALEATIEVHLRSDATIGAPLALIAAKLLSTLAHIQ